MHGPRSVFLSYLLARLRIGKSKPLLPVLKAVQTALREGYELVPARFLNGKLESGFRACPQQRSTDLVDSSEETSAWKPPRQAVDLEGLRYDSRCNSGGSIPGGAESRKVPQTQNLESSVPCESPAPY